ncbi:MAG: amino acid ABC transporter permease [Clostridia bacterium]|jgi:polar amino acid transport system permease protein|nr:amino acid ABC transporter permease [Clostridia bacterium]
MGNFQVKWEAFSRAFFDNGGYKEVLSGLQNTVLIAVIGLAIGIVLGTLLAIAEVMPQYKTLPKILNKISHTYVAFFRGTPIVVQLLVGYFVLRPLLGLQTINALTSCIIIFGMNSGAYVSEIMRGGINSVDPGQMEGGRSVGLSYSTTMLKIVIPQAIKNILPSLGNEFIALIKDTSIVSFVGAKDLYVAFKYIGTNNYEFMVPYLIMALIYIVMVLMITALIKLTERRLKKSDRSSES